MILLNSLFLDEINASIWYVRFVDSCVVICWRVVSHRGGTTCDAETHDDWGCPETELDGQKRESRVCSNGPETSCVWWAEICFLLCVIKLYFWNVISFLWHFFKSICTLINPYSTTISVFNIYPPPADLQCCLSLAVYCSSCTLHRSVPLFHLFL